jgi:sugar-specific transcriptional regulator TrmB
MSTKEYYLQQLGLTANEIKVYSYLLKNGESAGGEVYRGNNMDKSSAYDALHGLENKGLVYSVGQSRNQRFGHTHVARLQELLSNKERELQETKEQVTGFITELTQFAKENYKSKNIRVIEGPNAYEQWAYAKLEAPAKTILRELVSFERHTRYAMDEAKYAEYSKRMPEIRAKKEIRMKSLSQYPDDYKNTITPYRRSNTKTMKESRILPKGMVIPASMAIYGSKVSFMSEENEQFLVVIIDNQPIASMVTILFDQLWQLGKVV